MLAVSAAVAATAPDGGSVSVPEAWLAGFPDVLTAVGVSGSVAEWIVPLLQG